MFNGKGCNNYRNILNLIFDNKEISRTQLSEILNLRPATVSNITHDLISNGYVIEKGHFKGGKGRRQTKLRLNKDKFMAIAATVNLDTILVTIVDIYGDIIDEINMDISTETSYDKIYESLADTIRMIMHKNPGVKPCGIGVAKSGLVNTGDSDFVLLPSTAIYTPMPLKEYLEKELGYVVRIDNRIRMKTLTEMRFGFGKGIENFFMFNIDKRQISMSIVANGKVITGNDGFAGEVGHVKIAENGPLCFCGNYGCLESVVSAETILKDIKHAITQGNRRYHENGGNAFNIFSYPKTFSDLIESVGNGDKLCRTVIESAGNKIGSACAMAINILNPGLIVFSGEMCQLGETLINSIINTIEKESLCIVSDSKLKYYVSKFGEEASSIGAAMLLFETILNMDVIPMPN